MISKEKIEGDEENIALDTCSFLCREDFIFLNDHRAQNLELLFFSGLNCQGICHACWMHQQTFVVC